MGKEKKMGVMEGNGRTRATRRLREAKSDRKGVRMRQTGKKGEGKERKRDGGESTWQPVHYANTLQSAAEQGGIR